MCVCVCVRLEVCVCVCVRERECVCVCEIRCVYVCARAPTPYCAIRTQWDTEIAEPHTQRHGLDWAGRVWANAGPVAETHAAAPTCPHPPARLHPPHTHPNNRTHTQTTTRAHTQTTTPKHPHPNNHTHTQTTTRAHTQTTTPKQPHTHTHTPTSISSRQVAPSPSQAMDLARPCGGWGGWRGWRGEVREE